MVAAAKAATGPDTYSQLNLFGEVFERIRTNYVEKPRRRQTYRGVDQCMIAPSIPTRGT